jgi:hypothetical protein
MTMARYPDLFTEASAPKSEALSHFAYMRALGIIEGEKPEPEEVTVQGGFAIDIFTGKVVSCSAS